MSPKLDTFSSTSTCCTDTYLMKQGGTQASDVEKREVVTGVPLYDNLNTEGLMKYKDVNQPPWKLFENLCKM